MINTDSKNRKGVNLMTKNAVTPVADDATDGDEAATEEITFSAKDLATAAGTDPKSFRRWLRDYTNGRANQDGRWVFDAATRDALLEAYATRNNAPEADDEVDADAPAE